MVNMKSKVNCEVVMDLLPLYQDNTVSDRTKEVIINISIPVLFVKKSINQ